jgi:signal transduction histidine kinase
MASDADVQIRRVAHALSDIASALESVDSAGERIQQVLALTRRLIPCRRAALLKMLPDGQPEFFASPGLPARERSQLVRLYRLVADPGKPGDENSASGHLTLPVMGLDRVVGILRLESAKHFEYDVSHLRLLSLVAAQLGAYLTMIRLREEEAEHAHALRAAHEFQQRLAGIVSHDLRTPLTVITATASTLLGGADRKRVARGVARMLRNAQKADRIVGDLLDATAARVSGGIPIARQPTSLRALLRQIVEDARLSHPERKIALNCQRAGGAEGHWDPVRIAQITHNLINNAAQHGGAEGSVRISLRVARGEAVISVRNRGAPIPRALLPVIFDPFVHGVRETKTRARGGLGLGLYIVDQLARAHGGRVAVRSSESRGTVFTVRLPGN